MSHFLEGRGGPEVPPLDPVELKIEELLGEKNETVGGIISYDLGYRALR